jgi:hypothetical protein
VVEFLFRKVHAVDLATLEAAATNSDRALEYLLLQWQRTASASSAQQTNEPVRWEPLARLVAKHCRRTSTLDHVFSLCGDFRDIKVEELLVAAVGNQRGVEMLRYLFRLLEDGGVPIEANTAMLKAAASNPAMVPEMLQVLFNECDDKLLEKVITEEVPVKAVSNDSDGPEAFRMLLIEEGVAEKVNDRVLQSAGRHSNEVHGLYSRFYPVSAQKAYS